MKILSGMLLCLALAGSAYGQGDPVQPLRWDSLLVSVGVGSTILPTPILATMRLGDGGGGIIGGNVTINTKITRGISEHWRIPLSLSMAFLRGDEQFWHRDVVKAGDTVINSRLLSNSSNVITAQAGVEYFQHHELISPYAGVDFAFSNLGATSYDYTIPVYNQTILHQSLPAKNRFGIVLRLGAEFPIIDQIYYDVSAELGAMNLFGRPNTSDSTNGQVFVPTQFARDEYASRFAEGKTGEAVATYFRLLVKVAWKF